MTSPRSRRIAALEARAPGPRWPAVIQLRHGEAVAEACRRVLKNLPAPPRRYRPLVLPEIAEAIEWERKAIEQQRVLLESVAEWSRRYRIE